MFHLLSLNQLGIIMQFRPLLILSLSLLISSCGERSPKSLNPGLKEKEPVVNLSQNIVLTANNETEGEVISFGTYSTAATVKTVRVTITNSSSSSIQINDLKTLIEAWDDDTSSPNSVVFIDAISASSRCSNKTLSKTKSCYFDVTLSYNVELDNNSLIIPIRGTDLLTSPTLNLFMDVSEAYLQSEATIAAGASFVKNTEVLNFGNLLPNTSATRRLYISNTNLTTDLGAPAAPEILPAGLVIERNICTGIIKSKGQCFIDFKYSHQAANLSQVVSFSSMQMSDGQKSLNLVANNLQDNITGNEPKLSFVYENFPASTDAGGSYIRRLTITNNSTLLPYTFGANEVGSLFFDPSLSILRNTCDAKVLGKGKTCYVDVQHQPTLENQQLQITLALPNANVAPQAITAGPPPVACTPANSGISNSATVSGNTPSCTVLTCNLNYDKVGNTCVAQSCIAEEFPFSLSLTGDKAQGCLISTCQPNYSLNTVANTCEPTLCVSTDISNAETVSGNKVAGCIVNTCQDTFSKVGNTCVLANITRACTIQPNNSTQGLETSLDGGVTFGQCTGFVCDANYTVSGQTCIAQSCNVADFSGASVVTGDKVAGCVVQSCTSPLKEVVANTCVDKTPDGTISFDQSYTKVLTPNTINITSTEAQHLQFYNEAGCLTPVAPAIPLTATNTNMTLSGSDGIKTAYAKFINGSASSACKSASITLDRVSPAIAISVPFTSPVENIAGSNLNVTGTCSELNAETVGISVLVNGVTNVVDCENGTFTTSFDISSLAAANYSVSASATDLAENFGTASTSFNKIICSNLQTLSGSTCVDKTPNGTISFDQAYTKILTPNVLNISSVVDAQQLQFYSEAGCSTPVGQPVVLPATSTNITLTGPDGVKTAYAKFINGTASSSCKTASITFDQTAPTISINLPTSNQSISTATVDVSGNCSDSLSGVRNSGIEISIAGQSGSQSVSCSSGIFSFSYPITGLANSTTYTINLSATDNALNNILVTRNFVKASFCTPNATQSCLISNGTGIQTCNAGGTAYDSCTVATCNRGFTQSESMCQQNPILEQVTANSFRGFSGDISQAFPLDDGSVIYIGTFTSFVDSSGVSHAVNRIIKINPDGTVNTEFKTNIGSGFNDRVTSGVLDSTKSNLYVIGTFTQLKGASRGEFAKISVSGLPDPIFNTNTGTACGSNCTPSWIDRDSNNNIYLSGSFQYFGGVFILAPSTAYAPIMKFSPSGVRDIPFQTTVGSLPEAETVVTRVSVNRNNNHLIVNYCNATTSVCGLIKMNPSGVRDNAFSTNAGTFIGFGLVYMVFDSSNNIYMMTNTTSGKGGAPVRYLLKYSENGTPNTAFNNALVSLNINNQPSTLGFDGTYLYLSGAFNTVTGGVTRQLLRLSTSGVWDSTFNATTGTNDANSPFQSITINNFSFDASGNIFLVGKFNFFNGKSANYQVKLNSSGETINYIPSAPELNARVTKIVQDSTGSIYLVGAFTCYGANPCSTGNGGLALGYILKLNPDLTINKDFLKNIGLGPNFVVNTIALDSSDNVYIGGRFTQVGTVANNARYIAKLNSAGTLNPQFSSALDVTPGIKLTSSGFNESINSIVIDTSNNLYIGGTFTQYKNTPNNARYIAKLTSSGAIVPEFSNELDVNSGIKLASSGFNAEVSTLALEGQASLYVGGLFTSFKGVANSSKYLAKLSTGGSLNSQFQSNYGSTSTGGLNSAVRAIGVDAMGNVFVGGDFTAYNGVVGGAKYLAKFNNQGIIDAPFMDSLDVSPGVKVFATSGFNLSVSDILIDNSDLFVVGSFTSFKGVANSAKGIAKLDNTGMLDTSFQSNVGVGFDTAPSSIMMSSDYRLYLCGYFTSYKNNSKKYWMTLDLSGEE